MAKKHAGTETATCAACGKPAEGNYAIHRDGFCGGPEVPLCDACGEGPLPTCEELWHAIAARRERSRGETHQMNEERPLEPRRMTEIQSAQILELLRVVPETAELHHVFRCHLLRVDGLETKLAGEVGACNAQQDEIRILEARLAEAEHERYKVCNTDWHIVAEQCRRERDEVKRVLKGMAEEACEDYKQLQAEVAKAQEQRDMAVKRTEEAERERNDARRGHQRLVADRDSDRRRLQELSELNTWLERRMYEHQARAVRLAESWRQRLVKRDTDPGSGSLGDWRCRYCCRAHQDRNAIEHEDGCPLADAPSRRPLEPKAVQREPTADEVAALTSAHRASVRKVAKAIPVDDDDEKLVEEMVVKKQAEERRTPFQLKSGRAPCQECERFKADLDKALNESARVRRDAAAAVERTWQERDEARRQRAEARDECERLKVDLHDEKARIKAFRRGVLDTVSRTGGDTLSCADWSEEQIASAVEGHIVAMEEYGRGCERHKAEAERERLRGVLEPCRDAFYDILDNNYQRDRAQQCLAKVIAALTPDRPAGDEPPCPPLDEVLARIEHEFDRPAEPQPESVEAAIERCKMTVYPPPEEGCVWHAITIPPSLDDDDDEDIYARGEAPDLATAIRQCAERYDAAEKGLKVKFQEDDHAEERTDG